MTGTRPTFTGTPTNLLYAQSYTLNVVVPAGATNVYVVLMDLGFVTHSVHMDQKLVKLVSVLSSNRSQMTITAPPNAPSTFFPFCQEGVFLTDSLKLVFSPGPGWLWLLADGVPSMGQQVMVGDGANPPEDPAATEQSVSSISHEYPSNPLFATVCSR